MANVLIAEDEEDLALLWRSALEDAGHAVDVVHDGATAVQALQGKTYDVVIVDFVMPEKGGLVVSGMARVFQSHPHVILVSGRLPQVSSVDPADIAKQIGVAKVLPKPVDVDRLLAEVDRETELGR
ncbi:MAG: response regulator [Filomicrobium sp.]